MAELLGFLPLALEQAGAYVRETRLALAAYLDRLRHFPALTMAKGRPRDRDPADTVASTFQVSIEQVRPVPGALAMLELCAFLDPGEIPRDLVAQRLDPPAEELAVFVTDPFALDEAVAVVRRFGLVKVTEQALSVHPLLQQALRDHLDSAATAERVGVCIQLLGAAFPSEDFWSAETWPVCERLLPHALAAAVHAERGAIKAAETGHLLGLAASYLHARGRFLDALDLRQRALATTEMVFGVDDIRTAAQLNELAATLLELQRLDEALDRRQRALRLLEQRLGADHPDVAQTLARMGLVLYRRGDYGPAQQVYERAWRIFKQQLGPDHPRTARALTSLGMVFKSTGRLQQAEEVMQEALQILEQQGADRLEVASALDNLGTTLAAMGRLYEARDALETARGIFEDHLGPDHLEVAWSWNHLGDVHFRLGALEAARTAYDRALTIRAALLPADHPDVAKSRAGHDAVLRQLAQRNRQSQEPEPW